MIIPKPIGTNRSGSYFFEIPRNKRIHPIKIIIIYPGLDKRLPKPVISKIF